MATLKSDEIHKSKIIGIIRASLNEVSNEELSNGCDELKEFENNNIESNEHVSFVELK